MKQLVLALVLFLGFAPGGINATVLANKTTLETIVTTKDFTPIEVKELPDSVQKAIAAKYSELKIKAAYFDTKDDGSKFYKVVFVDKDGKELVVYYSEKGEEL
jgi:hypothetical protein